MNSVLPSPLIDPEAYVDPIFRHRCCSAYMEVFEDETAAECLESRVFALTYGSAELYMDKSVQLIYNLRESDEWRSYVNEIDGPSILPALDDLALNPKSAAWTNWTQYQKDATDAEEMLNVFCKDDDRSVNARSSIQCSKCKSYDIDIECRQTRSPDEPMTIFCVCLNPDCRANWRTS